MTRLQRLCLDAVERCGDPYVSTLNVLDYVKRRRWFVSIAGAHQALALLETIGYLDSMVILGGDGGYSSRVYKRTKKIDGGELVVLTRGAR